MKYQASTRDLAEIKDKMNNSDYIGLSFMMKQKFSVGDILIKKAIRVEDDGSSGVTEIVRYYENSLLPQRYLVIYIDPATDIAFVKSILENGKLEKEVEATIDTDNCGYNEYMVYQVDPDFVDSTILGGEFDVSLILKEEKDRKDRLMKMNKTSSKSFSDVKSINKFIETMKPGDVLYYHENSKEGFGSGWYKQVVIKKPRKMNMFAFKETARWRWYCRRGAGKIKDSQLNSTHVLYIGAMKEGNLITTAELLNQVLYTSKPFSLKDQS